MKLWPVQNGEGIRDKGSFAFMCRQCGCAHVINTRHAPRGFIWRVWKFDGNLEAPTITPSVMRRDGNDKVICHLWVKAGNLEYCSDFEGEYAGKTVPMEDV